MAGTTISGVYSITNLKNGWRYIGSSEDVQTRLMRHQEKLEAGLHYLRRLQNDWSRHGRDAFDFEVLESYAGADLVIREQTWINKFAGGRKLYNVALSAARKGSRKVKTEWVNNVQKQAETEIKVEVDEAAQTAFEAEHKKRQDRYAGFVPAGYALFLVMAGLAYAHSLHYLIAALGMAAGLLIANVSSYKIKSHAHESPALKASMIRSLKIYDRKEKAAKYIRKQD